jgi:hypothetical protein
MKARELQHAIEGLFDVKIVIPPEPAPPAPPFEMLLRSNILERDSAKGIYSSHLISHRRPFDCGNK